MYTVKKVAERLQVSIGTIYAAVADGRLRCYRLGRGRGTIRIAEDGLQEFLASSQSEGSTRTVNGKAHFRHLRI